MSSFVYVNPFRCRMWSMHDRLDDYITEETCKAEIDSFLKHGQRVPALGRALRGNAEYDVELIFGARRLFVARHINRELLVELRELSDREALVAMDIENRQRQDISPFERGLSYAKWLRSALFESQDELARTLSVSSSQVSRLLRLARLPSRIVTAFSSPAEICEGWGLELAEALEDADRSVSMLRAAQAIGRRLQRPTAREVYQELLAAAVKGTQARNSGQTARVVRDAKGTSLFRIQQRATSVAIVLPLRRASGRSLDRIQSAIASILQSAEADMPQAHLAEQRANPGTAQPICLGSLTGT